LIELLWLFVCNPTPMNVNHLGVDPQPPEVFHEHFMRILLERQINGVKSLHVELEIYEALPLEGCGIKAVLEVIHEV